MNIFVNEIINLECFSPSHSTVHMDHSMLFKTRRHIFMLPNVAYVRFIRQKTESHCNKQMQLPEVFYKKAVLENFANS